MKCAIKKLLGMVLCIALGQGSVFAVELPGALGKLEEDFQETWTILDLIQDKVCDIQLTLTCQKTVTPIFQSDLDAGAGTFMISSPGNYCVAEDLQGSMGLSMIVIAAQDVVLDLNSKTLTGTTDSNGIEINSNVSNIVIKNGLIKNVPSLLGNDLLGNGILVNNTVNTIFFKNIVIKNARKGFNVIGSSGMEVNNVRIEDIHMSGCSVGGLFLTEVHDCVVDVCSAHFNTLTVISGKVFSVNSSSNVIFKECQANNNAGFMDSCFFVTDSVNIYFTDCHADENRSRYETQNIRIFYAINSTAINCIRCYVNNNIPAFTTNFITTLFSGFLFESCSSVNLFDCHVDDNDIGNRNFMYLFDMRSSQNIIIKNCTANNNLLFQNFFDINTRETRGFSLVNTVDSKIQDSCVNDSRTEPASPYDITIGFNGEGVRNNFVRCSTINNVASTVWYGFLASSEYILEHCHAQSGQIIASGAAFRIPASSRVHIMNCLAVSGAPSTIADGFLVEVGALNVYMRNNVAQNYQIGFNVSGATHSIYDNYACDNDINYSIPSIYPISHPVTATPFDNIDCSVTPTAALEFQETWTILSAIEDKVCSVDSKIDSLVVEIEQNYQETWTILDLIQDKVCDIQLTLTCQKTITPIFQSDLDAGAGTFTISSPGNYCVAENLQGVASTTMIIISASDVTLDLNQKTLTGAINGNGIDVSVGVSNVVIKNGFINDVPSALGAVTVGNGILVRDTVSCLFIEKVVIKNCKKGVNFIGVSSMEINNVHCDHVHVSQATVDGFSLAEVHCAEFNHCSANFNSSTTGFVMGGSSNLIFNDCQSNRNSGPIAFGFAVFSCFNVYCIDCSVDENDIDYLTTTDFRGFFAENSTGFNVIRCYVNNNTGNAAFVERPLFSGFLFSVCESINLSDCHVDNNSAFGRTRMYCFDIRQCQACILKSCTANSNKLFLSNTAQTPRETRAFSFIDSIDCKAQDCCAHNSRTEVILQIHDTTIGFISTGSSARNKFLHCSAINAEPSSNWYGFVASNDDIVDSCYAQDNQVFLMGTAFRVPGTSRAYVTNCIASETSTVSTVANGFSIEGGSADVYLRNNVAQGFATGFTVVGTTHSVYDNYACNNTLNYSIPTTYPIAHPTRATSLDNIDCSVASIAAQEFQETWTVLDFIENKVCTIDSKIDVVDSKIDNFDFFVEQEFQETWTILDTIQDKVCDIQLTLTCMANVTPIFQSDIVAGGGQYVIGSSGHYCIAEDLTATAAVPMIVMASSDVVLDLNNKKLTGIVGASGIVFNAAVTNIVVKNGLICDVTTGIGLNVGDNCVFLFDLIIKSCTVGISYVGSLTDGVINNCHVSSCTSTGIGFDIVNNVRIENCTSHSNGGDGILLTRCNNITIRNCGASSNGIAGIRLVPVGIVDNMCVRIWECDLHGNTLFGGFESSPNSAPITNIWMSNFASGTVAGMASNFSFPVLNLLAVGSLAGTMTSYTNLSM